jgi:two-component system sensor histidine kinase AlgZ
MHLRALTITLAYLFQPRPGPRRPRPASAVSHRLARTCDALSHGHRGPKPGGLPLKLSPVSSDNPLENPRVPPQGIRHRLYPMSTSTDTPPEGLYLPDFCTVRMVLIMAVAAELLAYVLSLSSAPGAVGRWHGLILTSLFVQWVVLSSIALLCVCRRLMVGWRDSVTTLYSFGLVLAVTVVISEAAYWGGTYLNLFPASEGWHGEFLIRNLTISTIVTAVALRYFYVQYQLKKNIQAEAHARIQALQARVRPHFLFNSMNTIASLTRSDPALAEEVVEDLADLFRVNLADARTRVPLSEELALTRRYLHIEGLRLGERLVIEEDTAGVPQDAAIPMLTIQPLVENAVYHGIEPLPHGGTIRLAACQEADGKVVITVTNPHGGEQSARRPGNRLALDNVRQRLAAHFGARAALVVENRDRRYTATLVLPYEKVGP